MTAPDDLSDLDRVSTLMFDHAEADFPAIADGLGATIVRAGGGFESRGGLEGTNVNLNYRVTAQMMGPEPTIEAMASVLTGAGYIDVTSTPTERGPVVEGTAADGTATISVAFRDDPLYNVDYDVYLISEEELTISSSDRDTYRYEDHRQFDQSLVTPLSD